MQRQKSILSFFPKPSSENQSSGARNSSGKQKPPQSAGKQQNDGAGLRNPTVNATVDSSVDVRGTDTPPRQGFEAKFSATAANGGPSLFASIMHKFVKPDDRSKSSQGNGASEGNDCSVKRGASQGNECTVKSGASKGNDCSIIGKWIDSKGLPKDDATPQRVIGWHSNSNGVVDKGRETLVGSDITGPETPGMRPLVSRFKRVQDDSPLSEDRDACLLLNSKRLKILGEPITLEKKFDEVSSSTSKFEWLDPSRIRDSNKRRPDDPLYDRTTLYIPPDALKKMSASQKQYWDVKSKYMDVVIFFKVGKFYELYEIDAEIGHRELDWKMTLRGVGQCRQVGVPESGIDDAVQKLVARGYKVGRMEQLETSDQAKSKGASSVVSRKLVNVITPSTAVDGNIGPDSVHLLAIKEVTCGLDDRSVVYGFAFVDCASLRFWVGSINDDSSFAALGALLMQVSPKEILYESRGLSKEAQKALRKYSTMGSTELTPLPSGSDFLDAHEVRQMIQLKGYFEGSSNLWEHTLKNVTHHDITLSALGGLTSHLSRLMLDDVLRSGDILPYQVYKGCLRMEGQTLMNLEIFSNNADGGPSGTLYKFLDNCVTPSGKRLLRNWICHPLKDAEGINNRLNAVENLMAHSEVMLCIAQYLRRLPDLERLFGRVKASCHSSVSLTMPLIGKRILKQRVKAFGSLVKGFRTGLDLLMLLQTEEQISSSLLKVCRLPMLGGIEGLDKFLSQFEAAVESDFPNYQDHAITEKGAEMLAILMELFVEKASQWSEVINAINCIDVLRSFAVTASFSGGAMSRPVILPRSKTNSLKGPVLNMKGLWNPLALGENGGLPIPNDVVLGGDMGDYNPQALLLTGPNMGGKSTLLRATCIAVVLAQLGCYVPCEMCVLSIVDTIFTRLGATDRIMTGESTFLVECTETASVLQNASQDSLVVLDELGRGTSTFDGYAIAYAVFRHLVEKANCRLLFATHYHPLTKEFGSHPHVTLKHMACAFRSDTVDKKELVFLYRLCSGACPESYGLEVATMAGIPEDVVEAASKAAQVMKKAVSKSFRCSEQRSEFSTLHEEWLKALLAVSPCADSKMNEDDAFDTLVCLWHELKRSYNI